MPDDRCRPSTALATIQPAFTDPERLALAGFLAGYQGLTREAYALDVRQFTTGCRAQSLPLFAVRRADIETIARELEARGRTRATVTRQLCTIAGFYKYAVEEELLEHSPAAHVRRPRLDYESHAAALDRNELGALLVAAGLGPPPEHALISLLALNGLRVSEATGADIDHLGLERGHRTLTVIRKAGKVVTIPLAPRTARAIDMAIGERTGGPVFLAADRRRLDRHGAGRTVRRIARRAGIAKTVTPHTLRHAFVVERYRRAVEPAVRGVAGVVVTVAFFAAAAAVGGRAGVAVASTWVAIAGTYCLANFCHCREMHCAVTGPGWTLAAVLGFAAALAPGAALSWYRVNVETIAFLLILATGYGLEYLVAARTGRRALGKWATMPKIAEETRAARRDQIIAAALICFARAGVAGADLGGGGRRRARPLARAAAGGYG